MEPSSSLIPVVASALAALIAGGVAYTVAVLSKEQKTSEFRQAWIDGLRSDLADFIAGRTEIAFLVAAKVKYDIDRTVILESFFQQFPDLVSTEARYQRILLRINPREHKKLLAALQRLNAIAPLDADDEEVTAAAQAVTQEAQRVLKTEWNRVKEGETVFVWTKRVAVFVMLTAIATGLITLAYHAKLAVAAS